MIPPRKFIIVCGNQGYGKSVWTKLYCRTLDRLFVSDPLASYERVDFVTPPDEYLPSVLKGEVPRFRLGTYLEQELPLWCHAAFATGRCTLVIEECALIFKRGADLPEWFKPLVFMGRHVQVDLILVAQRANTIPVALRSQANRLIAFKQSEPDDLDALTERMGGRYRADEIDTAERIFTLEKLQCLDWDQDTNAIREYMIHP